MSNKIDSSVAATVPAPPLRAPTAARDNAGCAPRSTGRSDSVALTGEAQTLQQLEQKVRGEDGVDAAKVAEVRRQLAEGRYQVNAEVIASRLLQADAVLGPSP